MITKLSSSRKRSSDIIDADILIERLKKARALNRGFNSLGITEYKWRSFTIAKDRLTGKF